VKYFAAALLLLLNSNSLFAQNNESPFYIAVDIGITNHTFDGKNVEEESVNTTGYGAYMGYFVNPYVGFNIGYVDYGDTTLFSIPEQNDSLDFVSDAASVLYFATLKTNKSSATDRLNYYVNLGVANTNYQLTMQDSTGSYNLTDETQIGIWGGFGASIDINSDLKVTLDASWQVFDIDGGLFSDATHIEDLDVQLGKFSVGLSYQFDLF